MATTRLEHVGIVAPPATVDATQHFYETVFGWHVIKKIPGAMFLGDGEGGRIELLISDAPVLNGPNHLAFVVDLAAFDATHAQIISAGGTADGAPMLNPTGDRLFFFTDPSGNRAQIVGRETALGA